MQALPKDIRIHIAKHLDMDTRIKMSLVGKLYVPQVVKDDIIRTIKKRLEHTPSYTTCCVALQMPRGKYYTCFYDETRRITYWYFTDLSLIYRRHHNPTLRNVVLPVRRLVYEMPE